MSVNKYIAKPDVVEAVQFSGWGSADEIRKWGTDVFYVPRGYEHALRYPNEKDRSNGHTLEDAPEFLVVQSPMGDQRANSLDFIVRITGDETERDEFQVVSPADFREQYTSTEDSPTAEALDVFFNLVPLADRIPADYHHEYNILADALGLALK